MKRLRKSTMIFVGGLSMLATLSGWAAFSWLAPGPQTRHVPVAAAQPVFPVSTTAQAGLFFTSDTPGNFYQAPVLKTDVQFVVSGTMIRARVRQHFHNPSSKWLEGIYVFPLPEHSAVDRLLMKIGDRFVEGQIQEKEEARKTYARAKQEGKRASLVSSARDNLFTTRVANVGPDEEIIIEIQYADTMRYSDHTYSLRFPMVVAPRYVPGQVVINEDGEVGTTEVPDAGEILSPIHDPQQGPINPLTLTITLDPGFEAEHIHSLYHPITIQPGEGNQWLITLADGAIPADRDFVLEWHPPAGAGPTTHLIAEQVGPDTFLHGTVFPPGPDYTAATSRPRDLTVVVDVSGSMAGTSIAQVQQALDTLLTWLTPEDQFNLITFASITTRLFPDLTAATPSNIDTARRFVAELKADGGTELVPALEAALSGNEDTLRFQQVVVLTDGSIGYEDEMLKTIHRLLGSKRLFMVGIGSAPNSMVMREAAALGRGTFTYIGDLQETSTRMLALLKKLKHPAVTDLELEWPPHLVADEPLRHPEMYPSRIPDLYHGDPVTFDVKFRNLQPDHMTGVLRITGQNGALPWGQEFSLQHITHTEGVAKLWARKKIAQLMTDARQGKATQEEAKQAVVQVALAYQLVTTQTSLVAVDREMARPPGVQLVTYQLETNMPVGWTMPTMKEEGVFPRWLVQLHGTMPEHVMPVVHVPTLVALALPQTATAAPLHLLIGFIWLCLVCIVHYLRRQRRYDAVD